MGRTRATLRREDPAKKGRLYGELLARLLRERRPDSNIPRAYPSASLAWEYAALFRTAGYEWAAGPLVLYACGQLPAFVDCVADADLKEISASEIIQLLKHLPGAVDGSELDRRHWHLPPSKLEAFPAPSNDEKSSSRPVPDPVLLAKSISRDFALPYELQRRQVLRHLRDWLTPLARSEELELT